LTVAKTRFGGVRSENEQPIMLKGKICDSQWNIQFFEERERKRKGKMNGELLWPEYAPTDTMWSERLAKTPTESRFTKMKAAAENRRRIARGVAVLHD